MSPRDSGTYALAQSYNQLLFVVAALVPAQVVVQSQQTWPAIADTALRMSAALRLGLLSLAIPFTALLMRLYERSVGLIFFQLAVLQLLDQYG